MSQEIGCVFFFFLGGCTIPVIRGSRLSCLLALRTQKTHSRGHTHLNLALMAGQTGEGEETGDGVATRAGAQTHSRTHNCINKHAVPVFVFFCFLFICFFQSCFGSGGTAAKGEGLRASE